MKSTNKHQQLIETIQKTGWGSIENLRVKDGMPDMAEGPKVNATIRLGVSPQGPGMAPTGLTAAEKNLIHLLGSIGDGWVYEIKVERGQPVSVSYAAQGM